MELLPRSNAQMVPLFMMPFQVDKGILDLTNAARFKLNAFATLRRALQSYRRA